MVIETRDSHNTKKRKIEKRMNFLLHWRPAFTSILLINQGGSYLRLGLCNTIEVKHAFTASDRRPIQSNGIELSEG